MRLPHASHWVSTRLVLAIRELLAVVLDGDVAERAQLGRDVVAPDEPRDPRRQHRIVVELVAETRWLLEERHAGNLPRYRGGVNLLLVEPSEIAGPITRSCSPIGGPSTCGA